MTIFGLISESFEQKKRAPIGTHSFPYYLFFTFFEFLLDKNKVPYPWTLALRLKKNFLMRATRNVEQG